MSLFHFIGHTKVSIHVQSKCSWFATKQVFRVRSCQHLAQSSSWRTMLLQLSTTTYSIYSQLPSTLEAIPLSTTWGRTLMWWHEPTYHGGINLTYQNSIHEEIQSRMQSGNSCYHSVQNLLSSTLLSKNIKTKTCTTVILPVSWYGCEAWSLTKEETQAEDVWEGIWDQKRWGNREAEKTIQQGTSSSILLTKYSAHQINTNEMGNARGHIWGTQNVHTGFFWRDMMETDHLEDLRIDGSVKLE